MDTKRIAERLRELRGEKTLAEVASGVNVSQSAMGMYETGKRIPRDEVKKRLAAYYGKTVESIFFS